MRRSIILLSLLLFPCVLGAQDLTEVRELKQLWKFDEAIACLTQMMEEEGSKPVFLEELADCHYQCGNYDEALRQYNLLSLANPGKLLYKLRMMSLLNRGHRYEDVIHIGRDVLQRDSIMQVTILVGDAFNQLERRDSAEWYYRKALARRAHNESVVSKLSNILLGQKRFQEAYDLAGAFLAEEPDNLTALSVYGVAQFAMEQYEDARASFKRMRELDDDSYAVHYYLGKCAQKCLIPMEAEEEFVLAWERDTTDVGLAMTIAHLKGDRRAPDWEDWYKIVLNRLTPTPEQIADLASAHQGYAYAAYKSFRTDLCIEHYKLVLEYNPQYYASYYMIAQCYERKHDYKNALAWFKKGQTLFGKGTRGREICDAGAERVQAELFMTEK